MLSLKKQQSNFFKGIFALSLSVFLIASSCNDDKDKKTNTDSSSVTAAGSDTGKGIDSSMYKMKNAADTGKGIVHPH